ncbi:Rpn family recombination-promoting nuclease/putative transposase [Tepidibacter formicigenes]|jgi:predicted transposase/invertase (TIGR01784 family)|uniref:Rpn family recombination-promoting nuclease/putative transposase n=1 Tax=Tepidibacter formicigenes DSM 15518 TaxID=1123349 RepID=A0A1M6QCQ5_9FIRM|nr:Rpn family recombination-promoting nuclease/putative transposase [Tepidibacter formicigenes]SHK17920.1 conserved hypothetical protein (putative transposase or invertase) [Tepidibacter formicigenes DSM 15518]
MNKIKLMKPIVDFVFKRIFAGETKESKIVLIDLLNSILGLEKEEKIIEIIYLNPYNDKEYKEDKISIMDVKVKTQKDELIDIEVQINNRDNYRKRSLYYWSKMYGETIEDGDAYETLKKCIVVNILDFNLLKETKKYHSKFKVKDIEENFELLDDLEIHYLELPKFNDNKSVKEMNELEKWLVFIKDAGDEGKEELVNGIRNKSEVIDMAGKMLEKLSQDEKARQKYYQREKWLLDEKSKIAYEKIQRQRALEEGLKQGIKQGIEQGIEQGKIEIVKNLLMIGVDIEKIIQASGLSKKEIENIQKEIQH